MPDPYIISGSIDLADSPDRANLRVQVFDRDLPSLERRVGGTPPRLGEALTDREGRFRITYTGEQFSAAEGATTADVSFRVLDPSGHELSILAVRALGREYRGEQVIFNVPNPFDVVLSVRGARRGEGSEFELLLASVSPLIAPLSLSEIADEDVAFVAGELDYAERGDSRKRLEWLRRSALLAGQSGAPVEALYGWGRKGLPADMAELVAAPIAELPTILAKLSAVTGDKLREALLAAIAGNIISTGLRDRANAVAAAMSRRARQPFTLRLCLRGAATAEPLAGCTVATTDVDRDVDLGTDVTDSQGEFTVVIHDTGDAVRGERKLRFRVHLPESDDAIEITERVQPADRTILVTVPIASADRSLGKLQEVARLQLPENLVTTLQEKYGINSLAQIRRRGGLHRIAEIRNVDSPVVQHLDALADLDRLCKDLPEATALIDLGYESVLAIADATRATFVAAVSAEGSAITSARAVEIHIAAKAQTDLLDQMFAGIVLDIAAGLRPQSGVVPDEYSPLPREPDHV